MTTYNLADLFEAAADAWPDRLALVAGGERRSYRELDERANRFARHLLEAEIAPGEHVGICAYNRAEWVEAMLGCFKVRAVPINVNYRYVADELRYLFSDAGLAALVFERTFAPRVTDAGGPMRTLIVVEDGSDEATNAVSYEDALAVASAERDFAPRSGDDRYVVYTGGTTGAPKGVVWRHEDVYMALGGGIDPFSGERVSSPDEAATKAKSNESPMVMFPLAPLMHLSGQWGTLSRLFGANTVVLFTGRSFEADEIWRICADEKVNVLLMSGDAMARPLADALEGAVEKHDFSPLFSIASGAAIFSKAVRERFLELLPNAIVSDSVGSSEGGFNGMQMVSRDSGEGIRISPAPDVAVLEQGTWRPVEPGEDTVGRLARSGNIPLGYHNDPEKTASTFVEADGRRWVIPGDNARVEADGAIVLLGRGSTCVNTGGEKVYPEEVEAVVKSHPDVYDCLVVGVPDERWGERVVALVQPRDGATITLEKVQEHCRDRLAGYKVPREVRIAAEVPRHATGKPDYPRAKALASAG